MGLFGTSFDEKVQEAVAQLRGRPGVAALDARIDGKVVTLSGAVSTMEVKTSIMKAFNAQVETENTINQIRVAESPAAVAAKVAPPAAAAAETIHEVVRGDTLSGIAKKYYGKASLYPKIFEANRDQLENPDMIKVGQKLRIPKL
jgi:nucleoid-associated protein YgaU